MAAIITIFGWAFFSFWSAILAGIGLGELKSKVWRIGLMSHSSRKEHVGSDFSFVGYLTPAFRRRRTCHKSNSGTRTSSIKTATI